MEAPVQQPRSSVRFFEWRWVVLVIGLFVVATIAQGLVGFTGMLSMFNSSTTVDGVGVVRETPDQYQFTPAYIAESPSSVDASTKVTEVGSKVVTKLKELGVASDDITISVDSNSSYTISDQPAVYIGTYAITALVSSIDTARAVTEYLVTTGATGSVSPMGIFSPERRSQLEIEARAKAIENAKEKATQTAQASGKKLGKLMSIYDNPSMGYAPYPSWDSKTMTESGSAYMNATSPEGDAARLTLMQTGKQEITAYVSATYYLR